MLTKLHHRTAQTLVRDMWKVDWFNNEYTCGCFGEEDFWLALTEICEEQDVLDLRAAMDAGKTADWYYDEFQTRF